MLRNNVFRSTQYSRTNKIHFPVHAIKCVYIYMIRFNPVNNTHNWNNCIQPKTIDRSIRRNLHVLHGGGGDEGGGVKELCKITRLRNKI